ncbi:MAG: hypothetical protein ABIO51_01530 [Solirubrobacteraceae bacterium]
MPTSSTPDGVGRPSDSRGRAKPAGGIRGVAALGFAAAGFFAVVGFFFAVGFFAAGGFFLADGDRLVAAGASVADVSAGPALFALSRRALRRCGRVRGRLDITSGVSSSGAIARIVADVPLAGLKGWRFAPDSGSWTG